MSIVYRCTPAIGAKMFFSALVKMKLKVDSMRGDDDPYYGITDGRSNGLWVHTNNPLGVVSFERQSKRASSPVLKRIAEHFGVVIVREEQLADEEVDD